MLIKLVNNYKTQNYNIITASTMWSEALYITGNRNILTKISHRKTHKMKYVYREGFNFEIPSFV